MTSLNRMARSMKNQPKISVIIPAYNEGRHIGRCLESLLQNDYPRELVEMIVVDGLSNDSTVSIVEQYASRSASIRLLFNKDRLQTYAMNIGIKNAHPESEVIIRIDAHSLYPEDYIRKCVETLEATGADNAGGVMAPCGDTAFQKAMSVALSHPLGVGNARFHLGDFCGEVDTVYLGAFRKDVFGRVGLFDTDLATNEDAEMNLRIRKSGGKIYLNSAIKAFYWPRDSWTKLLRQFYRYGKGRAQTTLKHGRITSYRQILPVLLLLYLAASVAGAFFSGWSLIGAGVYLGAVWLSTLKAFAFSKPPSIWLRLFVIFPTMHIAWGAGFWSTLARKFVIRRP